MELQLKNPIVFFDLETTGLDIVKDRVVELSYIKVYPGGKEEKKTYRVNPEMPIPSESTAVHHITDEDVKHCPTFKQIAQELADVFKGCDLGGYNSSKFDLPVLAEEFRRADVEIDLMRAKMVDVQVIFHKMEPRNLSAAYRFYCGAELEGAHGACADTTATYEVLKAQLDRYSNLKNDVDFLSQFTMQRRNVDPAGRVVLDDAGHEVINFGKYKGRRLEDVLRTDTGYFGWIMSADFAESTKQVFVKAQLRLSGKI
ncbi:MAG: 3'-5' exonuclease [Paludibacteraceae bacterium]|nr:3'-5' exonuclease [Paludibacteraceae bacterium]